MRSPEECRKSTIRKGHKGQEDQKPETGFVASVFVVFVAFPYCDVLKVAHR